MVDLISYTLPMYDSYSDTWMIDNCDGTFKTVSDEEYRRDRSTYGLKFLQECGFKVTK